MATREVVQPGWVEMPLSTESLGEERIAYLERLVRQARTAAAVFTQFTQEDVDRIVKAMVLAGLGQAQYLARLAVEETKLGIFCGAGRYVALERWPIELRGYFDVRRHIIRSEVA